MAADVKRNNLTIKSSCITKCSLYESSADLLINCEEVKESYFGK